MSRFYWSHRLLIGGLVAAMASSTPALLLAISPPVFSTGFIGALAALLLLTVTPLALLFFSAGVVLLVLGLWARRGQP